MALIIKKLFKKLSKNLIKSTSGYTHALVYFDRGVFSNINYSS